MVEDPNGETRVTAATQPQIPESQSSWLAEMYRLHSRAVFRAAYRVTGSVEDSEDVLHTVFLRLSKRTEPFDSPPIQEAYLKRAATNAALDVLRVRKRRQTLALDEAGESASTAPSDDPDQMQTERELVEKIRAALAEIGGRGAEYFALRFLEGLENGEIAHLYDTSPGAVSVEIHRTRKKIKKSLGPVL